MTDTMPCETPDIQSPFTDEEADALLELVPSASLGGFVRALIASLKIDKPVPEEFWAHGYYPMEGGP